MSTQLSFSLRVSSGAKTVHLIGSWDNYVGQLPLSKDRSSSSKSGSWKGTFKFGGSTLCAGQRYWYYYIIDGYHVAHNPSVASTVEPTTGRALNILDVPSSGKSSSKSSSRSSTSSSSSSSSSKSSSHSSHTSSHHSSRSSRHSPTKDGDRDRDSKSSRHRSSSRDIPKGRPLSISQIKAPKPISPHAAQHILNSDYDGETMEELTARFGAACLDQDGMVGDYWYSSSSSSSSPTASSLSYRSDSSSPNSSMSGYSTPGSDVSNCTCERYGITRKGDRVKIDCGGSRCGYDFSDCSGSDEDRSSSTRRRRCIVVR